MLYKAKAAELGLYGALRHQERDALSVDQYTPFVEGFTTATIDLSGRFSAQVPGSRAFTFGEFEAAMILGSTSLFRGNYGAPLDPTASSR